MTYDIVKERLKNSILELKNGSLPKLIMLVRKLQEKSNNLRLICTKLNFNCYENYYSMLKFTESHAYISPQLHYAAYMH